MLCNTELYEIEWAYNTPIYSALSNIPIRVIQHTSVAYTILTCIRSDI